MRLLDSGDAGQQAPRLVSAPTLSETRRRAARTRGCREHAVVEQNGARVFVVRPQTTA
jgi:hypothetical protein